MAAKRSRLSALGYVPYVIAIAAMVVAFRFYDAEKPEVVRSAILPPENTPFDLRGYHPGPAVLSPDGRKIAFTARGSGGTMLYVRTLEETEPRALPGTEGAGYPFWSPDGRSLAFFSDTKLKRVEISGVPPITLCDAAAGKGGTWNRDDVIVFARSFNTGLSKMPASGGEPEPITEVHVDEGENSHRFPEFLPDGKHFIFLARGSGSNQIGQVGTSVRVGSVDGTVDRVLMPSISNAVYASGHLLFLRESVLMARPFDTGKLEFTGDAFPVAHQVRYIPGAARGIFSASEDGKLVYQAGASLPGNQLVWVDVEGNEISRLGDPAEHDVLRLSPDGNRVAVEVYDEIGGTADLWIYEIERGIRTRFTFDPAPDNSPVWSPAGNEIIFGSGRGSHTNLYRKSLGGSGTEELILESDLEKWPTDWSSDGKHVLFNQSSQSRSMDIFAMPVGGGGEPFAVLATDHTEFDGRFSPDNRWISYTSNESGSPEVYVRPFPGPGRRWQVSPDGGAGARWGGNDKLFFQSMDGTVHVAAVDTGGDSFRVGEVERLFETGVTPDYQVAAGGTRLLIIKESDVHHLTPLTLVLNWLDDPVLRR